ncbi:MAG: hypothetical protein KIT43_07775 [Bauldia sp.]|nr:hypothetical protein [Bauldia sp.]
MRKTTVLGLTLLSTVAFAPTAFAADPVPPPIVVAPQPPPPPAPPTLAGYVDAHFGMRWAYEEIFFDGTFEFDEEFRENVLGGAGRAAWNINPSLALQMDAWFNMWQLLDEEELDDPEGAGGVGMHVVFGSPTGIRFGALASVGRIGSGTWSADDGTWVNLAGELAATFGAFRVSTQGGFSLGIAGDAADDGERAYYAVANATFYPTDNLAITGHAGWDRWYETDDGGDNDVETTLTVGARAELKIGATPMSIYGGYAFDRAVFLNGDDPETIVTRSHMVYVGVRMLLGRDTLRALDNAVPFADWNPIYGDPFAHR